ncbi:MAG TPA: 1,2-phenylacetyl-CoA epoxidase subunit PaaD [Actinomycetes bacterium]|nr:1,2-phenylacetyl-CoA epoxidase subunit PaaD [Actinomycetes bacterium]
MTGRRPAGPGATRRAAPAVRRRAAPEAVSERAVREALADVPDPEIPAVSVVDLGIVHRVGVAAGRIRVELLPTFAGCPAVELMRAAAAERLAPLAADVEVTVTLDEPWTSDRITAAGRDKLRASGFAPPGPAASGPGGARGLPLLALGIRPREPARCPWCGSRDTRLENPFGPTLCRAIHWCSACRQPFEEFKSV